MCTRQLEEEKARLSAEMAETSQRLLGSLAEKERSFEEQVQKSEEIGKELAAHKSEAQRLNALLKEWVEAKKKWQDRVAQLQQELQHQQFVSRGLDVRLRQV